MIVPKTIRFVAMKDFHHAGTSVSGVGEEPLKIPQKLTFFAINSDWIKAFSAVAVGTLILLSLKRK